MKYYDYAWNPFFGCEKCSEGCENCKVFENLAKQGRDSFPAVNEKSLLKPPVMKGATVAVCSSSDMFHPSFGDGDIRSVLQKLDGRNTCLICTKRSDRMRGFFKGERVPVMMGVSIESQSHIQRAWDLVNTNANFSGRWIAVEPLLGEVDLVPILKTGKIDWVMVGAEFGENARPCPMEWIRKVVSDCRKNGVKVFVNTVHAENGPTDDISLFPEDLKVREFSWDRGEEVAYVGDVGYVAKKDGYYEVESNVETYGYFTSNKDYYFVELIRTKGKKLLYKVKVEELPPKPNGSTIRNYWHYIQKKEKETR